MQAGWLTELCGVPGVGKTQLAMQLSVCAAAAARGCAGGGVEVVYID